MTSACLNTLSFMAPRNCTPKNGPKRRSPSSLNWLRSNSWPVSPMEERLPDRSRTGKFLEHFESAKPAVPVELEPDLECFLHQRAGRGAHHCIDCVRKTLAGMVQPVRFQRRHHGIAPRADGEVLLRERLHVPLGVEGAHLATRERGSRQDQARH